MIFRDPTCPYGAVVVAVVVCAVVYIIYYITVVLLRFAHTCMIHQHCDMYFQRKIESTDSDDVQHTFSSSRPWSSLACSWSSWSAVCVCSAEGAASVVSERRSFARSCAFRLVNLAEGLLVCAAGEENFAVCVRQARSHLFAYGRAL